VHNTPGDGNAAARPSLESTVDGTAVAAGGGLSGYHVTRMLPLPSIFGSTSSPLMKEAVGGSAEQRHARG